MKTSSLWVIRFALTVQFVGVLAVPALLDLASAVQSLSANSR